MLGIKHNKSIKLNINKHSSVGVLYKRYLRWPWGATSLHYLFTSLPPFFFFCFSSAFFLLPFYVFYSSSTFFAFLWLLLLSLIVFLLPFSAFFISLYSVYFSFFTYVQRSFACPLHFFVCLQLYQRLPTALFLVWY